MEPKEKLTRAGHGQKGAYSETERRVIRMERCFTGVHDAVENAASGLDMLLEKWDDILLLDEYMSSGDWLKDFEADERGEISKDISRGVLAEDALYNELTRLNEVLKGMQNLIKEKAKKEVNKLK